MQEQITSKPLNHFKFGFWKLKKRKESLAIKYKNQVYSSLCQKRSLRKQSETKKRSFEMDTLKIEHSVDMVNKHKSYSFFPGSHPTEIYFRFGS